MLIVALSSCEKAVRLVDQTKLVISTKLVKNSGAVDVASDPELQKLVDETPEGVIFRKDLPFPKSVEVKITSSRKITGRFTQKSELEKNVKVLNGVVFTKVIQLARHDNKISYTLVNSILTEPDKEKKGESYEPVVSQVEAPSAPYDFTKTGSSCKPAVASDFRAATRAMMIGPSFDVLLIENAIAPRALWFGKKRYKIGDQLSIQDDTLPMFVAGKANGHLKLSLESLSAVNGHPCGVWTVKGEYTRKNFPDFNGTRSDESVTIDSGKLWLSLLYPVILKEEMEIIHTVSSGEQGGLIANGQCSAGLSIVREWKGISK